MTERPTAETGAWAPPKAAVTAARGSFADLVASLDARASEYRVNTDLLDDAIYGIFLAEVTRMAGALGEAIAAGDEAELRRRGHSLEGMGGTVGLPELSIVGVELSLAARGHDWDRCALLVERLRQWLALAGEPSRGGARE